MESDQTKFPSDEADYKKLEKRLQMRLIDFMPLLPAEEEALRFLLPLSHDYPGIENWFRVKVVPGLRLNTRVLLRIERHSKLIGVAIGKREEDENKICTVRVSPEYFGLGIGVRLFDQVLRWLDDDQPHLTVSECRLPAFERIFDKYGFNLTSARRGLYRSNSTEMHYNEVTGVRRSTVERSA